MFENLAPSSCRTELKRPRVKSRERADLILLSHRPHPKTAPSEPDGLCFFLVARTSEPQSKIIRVSDEKQFTIPRENQGAAKCGSLSTALRRTGVKVSSVAVTLKQWWRDVGLCPRPPRATIGTITTKHRCRRTRSMGHSLSMCKLQHCRHKKSK